jgi:hypothetical protein
MNKTLFTLLIGLGAGYALFMLLHSEKGQVWKDKIADMLGDVGEELKNKIMSEIEKFEASNPLA